ncbi:hypothetical protein FN846DRAFT_999514 [Sphaerosporella brunnea]|uniref:Uncharacterized protein n=1 Tax=Sphaerosporella brunnea TaxID=1250544 RepID=A0A5J5EI41_9PEZI|nr:hypothetical protein FN846DRAFT_999514 [Sphaerosporella brunnea]
MPRGFGDGKPPRELEDDPIDDEEQPRRTSITSTRPPVSEQTTGHVDEQDIIGPPFSDRRNTMSGTAVLSGYHRPRNTLHGSSNTSRKRQQTSIQEVEQLQAEQAKKRCVSGFEPASTFSDEEKRPARTKQRTGMGAGIGRSKQAQAAAQAKKSVHLDPSSDDDDQYRQLQLPPRFKKEENQRDTTTTNAQKGKLVSRKLTGWKLSTFQFGTDQVDSSKDGALELVITNKAIKVMRDGNEWPVEWNKLLQLKVGPSSFALIFEGNRENRFGYFALARSSDMSAVTEALGKLLPEAISYVDEGAIRKHYNNIMVWQEKRDLALPLVDDPSDAKQQQENNDRQCAEMLNGEMRKEGLHRMTRSNKPVLQVEIPSLSPRRPQLSKPVIMETTKRTLARPFSLEDSDDHKDKETVPTLFDHRGGSGFGCKVGTVSLSL